MLKYTTSKLVNNKTILKTTVYEYILINIIEKLIKSLKNNQVITNKKQNNYLPSRCYIT